MKKSLRIATSTNDTVLSLLSDFGIYLAGFNITFVEMENFAPQIRLANGTWTGGTQKLFEGITEMRFRTYFKNRREAFGAGYGLNNLSTY
jgi:hypothetical protein